MDKPNKAINDQRVTEVMQLILQGAEFNEIRQYAANKGWELTDRQVRRHMSAAYKRTTEILHQEQNELLCRHLMQRRGLYARCLKAEDLRTALQVLHDEAALLGLYPVKKIAPTTPDGKDPYEPVPGLTSLLPELQEALERLGCGLGEEDPESAEASSGAGADQARSGPVHGLGGAASGPLAEEVAPLPIAPELTPLLSPGGEEYGDGGPGPARGPA